MKIRISLNGSGGELDSHTTTVTGIDEVISDKIKAAIHRLIDNSIISVGDTIAIEEVMR
jgi:hypothetical protein